MRWTQTFLPTLKETPAEAEIPSHRLLLRAGLVRKLSGGLYTFLPLGLRALHKVEQIVREEMERAGARELLMPALQPPEIWQQSGRYHTASEVLYKVRDRSNREWLLGPTHEEVITTLVAAEFNSYRQFPRTFFQVQTKFRDELRPRFGLMRAREFVMKDAYSFDTTDEAARASYRKMYDAYERIFARCGLKTMAVEADTGVMGGTVSHEFMVPAESGENEVISCDACGYAANADRAESARPAAPGADDPGAAVELLATPGVQTIEDLTRPPYGIPAERQIKTLVYVVDGRPTVFLMRGDHVLNEAKLVGAVGTTQFRPAVAEEIFAVLGAHPGSLGAVGVRQVPVYADLCLKGACGMTTGANRDGYHLRHVDIGRDVQVTRWVDLRRVAAGECCARCGKALRAQRAIEVGHVFQLGTKYSEALRALFLDESGQQHPVVMGCYGIGVTRTLQAVIEQSHDEQGIVWPLAVAPYSVCITPLGVAPNGPVMGLAERVYAELRERRVDVFLDDREERPGVKFKDSELVGFPLRVAIGEKSLARGEVEIKPRAGALFSVKAEQAVERVLALLSSGE